MFFEPVNSKSEPPKEHLSNNLTLKSRKASIMHNSESTSRISNEQVGAEDKSNICPKYFSFKALVVLVCITISLLILPLVMPPLAPPPAILLLVPVCILAVLLILALKHSHLQHTAGLCM